MDRVVKDREGVKRFEPDPGRIPELVGTIEVEYSVDKQLETRRKMDPLKDEDFTKFAAILGSERFLRVLNHTRGHLEHTLRCWLLAVGFANAIEPFSSGFGPDDRRRLADSIYALLVDVVAVPGVEDSDAEYARYAEATQPLGFEGVEILEEVVGKLLDRVEEMVLDDSAKGSL
ncbi:MAG: hypothetical protein M3391_08660 [Actinomycetota bacterium]|nr:hypothetical protein [Actinomycetota bacterium]